MIKLSGATPSLHELDKNVGDFDYELADHMDGRPYQLSPTCGSILLWKQPIAAATLLKGAARW